VGAKVSYIQAVVALLERLEADQDEVLERVAGEMARVIGTNGLVHLFGSGHSVIPTLEAFPRYGSFVGLHPLTDPRLMWHNVLGPGGVRELLWLERTEGYVERFLASQPVDQGDLLIVFSHSGLNAAPIEAAMYGRARGVPVVAVTTRSNQDRPASHSSGKRLADVADMVIDTGVPPEDAAVRVDGWDRPVGGASTVVASVAMHELIVRAAGILAKQGIAVPTFVSPTVEGMSLQSNDEVFSAHRARLIEAQRRASGLAGDAAARRPQAGGAR
jgi:uncharacterized phosphosugar-binding protein